MHQLSELTRHKSRNVFHILIRTSLSQELDDPLRTHSKCHSQRGVSQHVQRIHIEAFVQQKFHLLRCGGERERKLRANWTEETKRGRYHM